MLTPFHRTRHDSGRPGSAAIDARGRGPFGAGRVLECSFLMVLAVATAWLSTPSCGTDGENRGDAEASLTDGDGASFDTTPVVDGTVATDTSSPIASCVPASGVLATVVGQHSGPFTLAIHVAQNRTTVLNYLLDTGPFVDMDEETARAAAQLAAMHGQQIQGASLIGVVAGLWLFDQGGGDFRAFTAVSAQTGHPVLGVEVGWVGSGYVSYPLQWSPADELGLGCPEDRGMGAIDDIILDPASFGPAEPDMNAVLATVKDTAVLSSIWANGAATETLVVQIPRYATSTDPHEHEWVVLISGVLGNPPPR